MAAQHDRAAARLVAKANGRLPERHDLARDPRLAMNWHLETVPADRLLEVLETIRQQGGTIIRTWRVDDSCCVCWTTTATSASAS